MFVYKLPVLWMDHRANYAGLRQAVNFHMHKPLKSVLGQEMVGFRRTAAVQFLFCLPGRVHGDWDINFSSMKPIITLCELYLEGSGVADGHQERL